tara:strand:+ start:4655 stop:4918 length:264 start_codon:yes stop_codon:yes gene_type:complete
MKQELRSFRIDNFYGGDSISLMQENPIIEAKNNKDALSKYLKEIGLSVKVRCSGGNDVQFGITPMTMHNGELLIDGRRKRSWYKVVQ